MGIGKVDDTGVGYQIYMKGSLHLIVIQGLGIFYHLLNGEENFEINLWIKAGIQLL